VEFPAADVRRKEPTAGVGDRKSAPKPSKH